MTKETASVVEYESERDDKGMFQKGQPSPNPAGRPKENGRGRSKPISSIRRNLTKIRKLEDNALEILELSMMSEQQLEEIATLGGVSASTGRPITLQGSITKAQVDSAKFIIKSIESMAKSATADELAELNLRKALEENIVSVIENDEEEDEKPLFSLTLSKDKEQEYYKLIEDYKPDE